MKTKIILTVTIVRLGRTGKPHTIFERSIEELNNLPGHLAQQELFSAAHQTIHPPRPTSQTEKD